MTAPVWVIVFRPSGEQWLVSACRSDSHADAVIFHNTYYGRRCLKVSVKNWKMA